MEEEKVISEEVSETKIEEVIETISENPTEEITVEQPVVKEMPPMETVEEPFGRELDREGLDQLNSEQLQRYSICHPDRCPNAGRPMPHSPHVPLYPTDWC